MKDRTPELQEIFKDLKSVLRIINFSKDEINTFLTQFFEICNTKFIDRVGMRMEEGSIPVTEDPEQLVKNIQEAVKEQIPEKEITLLYYEVARDYFQDFLDSIHDSLSQEEYDRIYEVINTDSFNV